jgi:predicted NAD/FAD-binding protein
VNEGIGDDVFNLPVINGAMHACADKPNVKKREYVTHPVFNAAKVAANKRKPSHFYNAPSPLEKHLS